MGVSKGILGVETMAHMHLHILDLEHLYCLGAGGEGGVSI